jgi:hypothetical protein
MFDKDFSEQFQVKRSQSKIFWKYLTNEQTEGACIAMLCKKEITQNTLMINSQMESRNIFNENQENERTARHEEEHIKEQHMFTRNW